jgi:phosphoadenosine phosphosulfate reductase
MTNNMPTTDTDRINAQLEHADAAAVVAWAAQRFEQGLIMTSSFGVQAAVMLHLATRVVPRIPVVLIDTGYLFPETYRFVELLTERLNLNLKVYQPHMTAARREAVHGRQWEQGEQGLQTYEETAKLEPMRRALRELGATAWLAGLRRQQTNFRANLHKADIQDGIYKILPILDWSTDDVSDYLARHDLPVHPLYERGYSSIGDVHSTRPVDADEHERDGRFGGLKQECGLHLPQTPEEAESRDSSFL